jgi:hypothetical protein
MPLPVVSTRTAWVDIGADDGEKVRVRSLTSPEMAEIQRIVADGDVVESEIIVLAYATDTPADEVRAWYGSVPRDAVQPLLDEIQRLVEARNEEASKSVPAGVHDRGTPGSPVPPGLRAEVDGGGGGGDGP